MRHEIALVALPAVRLDEIGKEKQFQHQKDDAQLDENHHP